MGETLTGGLRISSCVAGGKLKSTCSPKAWLPSTSAILERNRGPNRALESCHLFFLLILSERGKLYIFSICLLFRWRYYGNKMVLPN
jgi:hypothetical protein